MRRHIFFLFLILVAIAGTGCVHSHGCTMPMQPLTHWAGRQWEYATLVETDTSAVWDDPGQEISASAQGAVASGQLLYQKLGGTKPRDAVTGSDLVSLIGTRGWELIAIKGDREISGYYFKRPKH